MKELAIRVLVAAVGAPLIAAIILFGKIPLVLFVNLVVCLGLWEFYTLAGFRTRSSPQLLIMFIAIIVGWWVYYGGETALFFSLPIVFFILGLCNIFEKDFASAATRMVYMFYGYFYLSLFNFMILIRELEHVKYDDYRIGGIWIWFLLAVIWICDTAAYFVGKPFGRIKLSPAVSPNKTVEGFLAGLVFGTLAAYVFSLFALTDIPKGKILLLGFLISLIGQLADLIESLFKRRANAKDSSHLIPGHGGVLDRFDSLLVALPSLYFLLKYLIYAG